MKILNLKQHWITTNDGKIAWFESGDPHAPPVILVHGWLGAHDDWRETLPMLSLHHYCITLDLLGHGISDKPENADYSIDAQARRVLAIVSELGLDRFSLIGHSMGGMIVLYLAATLAAGRVLRLVNLAGILRQTMPFLRALIEHIDPTDWSIKTGFSLARLLERSDPWWKLLGSSIFYDPRRYPPDLREVEILNATQPGMETAFVYGLEAITRLDIEPLLPRITCPVLTIFGRQDRIVPLQHGLIAERMIPNNRLVILENCGHYLMLEKTDEYLQELENFFLNGKSAMPNPSHPSALSNGG